MPATGQIHSATLPNLKSTGRAVGAALLVQGLLAPPVYFVLMRPATEPGFLAGAAGSAFQIRAGLLLSFLLAAMTIVVAIVALPVFRRYSERLAFALLALSAVALATLAMESMATRNLLTLSLAFAQPGAPSEVLETVAGLARSARAQAHFTNLIIAHGTVLLLFVMLFRFALVPRAIAAVGVGAGLLSTSAMAATLLGFRFSFLLIMPVALSNLALVLWLLARGFKERRSPA